jgi:hypothetical protein
MTEAWLADPIALQMLYRIARGPRDIMGDLDAGWAGSDGQPRIRLDNLRADAVERNLRSAELVRRVQAHWEHEITERGQAFLEIIGPECEEPDVLGRWRDETGVIPRTAVAALDNWLLRFFGHLKERLARRGFC